MSAGLLSVWRVAAALAFSGLVPAVGHAQAVSRGHGARSAPVMAEQGCALCHRSHPQPGAGSCGSGASFLLTLGEVAPAGAAAAPCAAVGLGLGTASLFCLRCHSTPNVRARDPLLAASALASGGEASFLGDLADDHPLAPAGAGPRGAPSVSASALATRGGVPRLLRAPQTTGSAPTCTTCHRVHSGPDPVLSSETERDVCVSCHEPSRYLGGHATLACGDCHQVHGGRELALLRDPDTDLLCRSCHHSGAPARAQALGAPPMPQPPQHPSGTPPGSGSCAGCHPAHR